MSESILLGPILDALSKHGLPVGFLRYVKDQIPVERGKEDEVTSFFKRTRMKLTGATVDALKNPSPDKPLEEAPAIALLYHEGTHAYLELKQSSDAEVKRLFASGEQHYRAAPLQEGGTVGKPERVFHEATADYVGHRAADWWQTLERIVLARGALSHTEDMMLHQIERLIRMILTLPREYEKDMTVRVFGYEPGLLGRQLYTSKQMPDVLRDYCDRVLLEGKIPDLFARNTKLSKEYADVLQQAKRLQSEMNRLGARSRSAGR